MNEARLEMQTELVTKASFIGFPHRNLDLVNNVFFSCKINTCFTFFQFLDNGLCAK